MGENTEFAGRNLLADSPKNNNEEDTKTIFEISSTQDDLRRESLSFLCDDFGRESLGIIHWNNVDVGRESLGIFNLNSLDPGRESLGIINLANLDVGRESLGITNIRSYDFTLSKCSLPVLDGEKTSRSVDSTSLKLVSNAQLLSKSLENFRINNEPLNSPSIPNNELPEVLITSNNNSSVSSVLNRAFLKPTPSFSSSISSFNSASLETTFPSGIYPASTSSYRDTLNDAFGDTSQFMKHILNSTSSASSVYPKLEVNNLHRRINSLPSNLEVPSRVCTTLKSESNIDTFKEIIHEELRSDIEDVCCEDGFDDSVFIEGKHIASKIADGSILDGGDPDMLDSTQEPEDFVNLEKEEEPLKCDTETVFKVVDKMFTSGVPKDENHIVLKTSKKNTSVMSINSNSSDGSAKSKEAMEIINTLSEILNNDNPSDKQKSQGQNLLSSLAEILLSSTSIKSPSYILDDSGHSSIEIEPGQTPDAPESYEVLDLRKKSSEIDIDNVEPEICQPLDLSLKSKTSAEKIFVSPKILPPKFRKNQGHVSLINISNHSVGSNSSVSSNESKSLNDLSRKFKPRKPDSVISNLKKGPMKAVIPVDSMARRNSLKVTPKRSELSVPNHKLKKTSTPINESSLKPMAQSTPDTPRTICPVSPLARPSSNQSSPKLMKHKLNYSGTNLQNRKTFGGGITAPHRRGFSGDLKKAAPLKPFTRSYSFPEKLEPSNKVTSTKKILQRTSFLSKTASSTSVLKENRNKPVLVKPSTGKKFGKEN